jgi:lipopolysaccharide export system protein LptA
MGQNNKQHSTVTTTQGPTTQTIKIDHASSLFHDNKVAGGAQRLIGNVEIEDDTTLMFCDSAYVYSNNSFNAFGHVHLSRKDTINLYGDSLHYDGNAKRAQMFGKISYKQKAMTLTTQHLIYSVDSSFVHYWDGGKIVDSSTTLTSKLGTYHSKLQMASFKDNVVLVNPEYTVKCDTMDYAPTQQISYFFGPTHITSKSNFMYCEQGYYNAASGVMQFSKHAFINGKKGEKLSGDQIYYNKKKDFGQVLDNVALQDTSDNITIKGDYAQYSGDTRTIMVTCRALMLQEYDKDTLHLHADTLYGYNVSMSDTTNSKEKSPPKLLLAYHHVKFFKKDMQGKCDSLTYDEKDSIMRMFYSPVLWSDVNQLTADTIRLYMRNKKIDKMDMRNNAFIASKDTAASKNDSLQFNQIRGKNMRAYFVENKIHKVDVKGNSQTVYYVYSDNNTKIVGANRADCSSMLIFISDNKIKTITFQDKPDATLFPMKDVKPAEFLLKDFIWREKERPHTLEDIFKDTP